MYSGTIGKYRFEYDSDASRIMVYEEGSGVDAVAFIVVPQLTEKQFHFEIMWWVSRKQ